MNPTLEQVVAAITPLWGEQATPDQPPVGVGAPLKLPYGLDTRTKMVTPFPWKSARFTAPAANNDTNVWLIQFVAGPAQAALATLQAAEAQGGGIGRYSALLRDRDSAILQPQAAHPQTTITQVLTYIPVPPGPFAPVRTLIVPGEAYTLAIWNASGNPAGLMLAELVLPAD